VVGGAGVKVPAIDLVVAGPVAKEDVGVLLVKVEEHGGGWRGRRVQLNIRFITLLRLHDVCQTAALRLPAVLGLVVGPATVLAGVIVSSLALASGAIRSATLSRLHGQHLWLLDEPKAFPSSAPAGG